MRRLQVDLLNRLLEYQTKKRLSNKGLSKKLGVSTLTLAQWFEKHRKLRPRECQSVEDFLDREEKKKK